jgi:hypothetical protein
MRYGLTRLSQSIAYIITAFCILGVIYSASSIMATVAANGMLSANVILIGAVSLAILWFYSFKVVTAIEIEGNEITAVHLAGRERLKEISAISFKATRSIYGIHNNLFIRHLHGNTVLPFVDFQDCRGMAESLQKASGLKIENIALLK